MSVTQTILSRWRAEYDDVPRLAPVKAALTRTLHFHDVVRKEHAELAKDAMKSVLGRQDAMRKFVVKHIAAEIHRARKTIETLRASPAQWRTRLQPAPPDKTDLAAAVLRSEMRTMLRGLPNGQRVKLLMARDADPLLHAAVLEAPNFASGITDDVRSYITEAAIEKAHPGQLAAIEQAEEAIAVLNAAVRVTMDTTRAAAEFPDDRTFGDFVKGAVGPCAAQIDAEVERVLSA